MPRHKIRNKHKIQKEKQKQSIILEQRQTIMMVQTKILYDSFFSITTYSAQLKAQQNILEL